MKLVLFTFDYELFLGERSGTVQECIIKPTDRLLSLLDSHNYKGIFFVDTVYLLRLQELAENNNNARADYEAIIAQLQRMAKTGHEIHPHIHAHWLDAVYNATTNEWSLSNKRYYLFEALPADKRAEVFDASVSFIKDILGKAGVQQPVDAYRAGGWSIQPFNVFRSHFIRHGIVHEFSVIPGKQHISDAHKYDFRQVPQSATIYSFEDDICVEDEAGRFKEWCISAASFSKLSKWIYFKVNGIYTRLAKKSVLLGGTVKATTTAQEDVYRKNGGLRFVASFEQLNPYMVWKYTKLVKQNDYFQFISHPKLIFDADFAMLQRLLASLSNIKDIQTDFRKVA